MKTEQKEQIIISLIEYVLLIGSGFIIYFLTGNIEMLKFYMIGIILLNILFIKNKN